MEKTFCNLIGPPAELLDIRQLAHLLNCSVRHVYRLVDAANLPKPLKLGALARWRAAEIRAWIDAGCPSVRARKGGVR